MSRKDVAVLRAYLQKRGIGQPDVVNATAYLIARAVAKVRVEERSKAKRQVNQLQDWWIKRYADVFTTDVPREPTP